jgi:hypothetical protein
MKMKNILTSITLTAALLGLATSTASAALLVYDGFDYTAGQNLNTAGLNGGTGWDGAWENQAGSATHFWETTSGTLAYENSGNVGSLVTSGGYTSSAGDSNRAAKRFFSDAQFDTTNNSDVWFSMLLAKDPAANAFQINLFSSGSQVLQFDVADNIILGGNNLADNDSGRTLPTNGEAAFVVANFDLVNEEAQWWINPEAGATSPTGADYSSSVLSFTSAISDLDEIRIFSRPGTNTTNESFYDEIRMGTTYADVTPIPEPSAAALLLGGLASVLLLRRRR